jgi:hypothetical protein
VLRRVLARPVDSPRRGGEEPAGRRFDDAGQLLTQPTENRQADYNVSMRMPRRRLYLALAATLVGTAVVGWFIVTRESPNLQRFRQINVGMPLEDVNRLFANTKPVSVRIMVAGGPGLDLLVETVPGWHWTLDDEVVTVKVDADQRVSEATYRCDVDRDPWITVVAGWFGIRRTRILTVH